MVFIAVRARYWGHRIIELLCYVRNTLSQEHRLPRNADELSPTTTHAEEDYPAASMNTFSV